MQKNNGKLYKLICAAIIGAVYAALTMLLAPISYGTLQFRVSEALCILPFFFPASAAGLFVGCIIANLISTAGLLDVIFGSLATLLAGLCTAAIGISIRKVSPKNGVGAASWGRRVAACAMPVIFNAPIVGAILAYTSTPEAFWPGLVLFGVQVGIGEAVVMFALGLPLMVMAGKNKTFMSIMERLG